MSDSLFRALLGSAATPPESERPSGRYEKGLVSSYLEHAEAALAAAEGLAAADSFHRSLPELARAAACLCKAVRLSHGLGATRHVDVAGLVGGDPARSLRGLPAESPWTRELAPLTALDDPRGASLEPRQAALLLRRLIARAHDLPRAPQRPSARGPRARRW